MLSGTTGIVMDVKVSAKEEVTKTTAAAKKGEKQVQDEYKKKLADLHEQLTEAPANILLGEKIRWMVNSETGEIIIPFNRKTTKTPAQTRSELRQDRDRSFYTEQDQRNSRYLPQTFRRPTDGPRRRATAWKGDARSAKNVVKICASKRKLSVGEGDGRPPQGVVPRLYRRKTCRSQGWHASRYLPKPLGVLSRMNVGQLLETHSGWAAKMLGPHYATPIFTVLVKRAS